MTDSTLLLLAYGALVIGAALFIGQAVADHSAPPPVSKVNAFECVRKVPMLAMPPAQVFLPCSMGTVYRGA